MNTGIILVTRCQSLQISLKITNTTFLFSFFRTRGVPSHLLGSAHFDDNSSDNSIDEKNLNRHSSTQDLLGGQQDLLKKCFDNLNLNDENFTNFDKLVSCKSQQDEILTKDDITPPPGAPRPENSARLRRYRPNLE